MRIGYLIDLHKGGYEQPMPSPEDAHDTMEAMIGEGIVAERAGFHSIQIPDRHGRTECYFPGPEQILTILARETDKVAIGSFTWLATLFHPMKGAEQFSVIDNLSEGRLYTTVSRGFHPGYWMQFGIPQEKLLGRFLDAVRIWNEAFKGERFTYEGKYWQVEEGLLAPQPYQPGGWPIWGGGNATPAAITRSATYGAAWTCDPFPLMKETWDAQSGGLRAVAAGLGVPRLLHQREGVAGPGGAVGGRARDGRGRGVAAAPDRPAARLVGLGREQALLDLPVLALVGEALALERLVPDPDRVEEPAEQLLLGDAELHPVTRVEPARDGRVEPPLREVVDHRELLGALHRVEEGGEPREGADRDLVGLAGEDREDLLRPREVALGAPVPVGDLDRVEARA